MVQSTELIPAQSDPYYLIIIVIQAESLQVMSTYLSNDVALYFIDEGDVPHVEELTQVVQDAEASIRYPRHTPVNNVACDITDLSVWQAS